MDYLKMILLCAVCLVLGTAAENVKRQSGYLVNQKSLQQNYPPAQPFRSPDDYEQIDVNTIAPTHPSIHQIAQKTNIGYRTQEPPRGRPQEFQQGKRPLLKEPLKEEELEEEEKEEPDRLTLLLPQSKFSCIGKRTGYYADEGLNCEVFHYCQDNAKHSWICPEGFLFHQVHLICMPPSHDNICAKSSQYHFINDYLYKAINMDEASQMPNVSLRYSERYYPNNFYSEEDVSRTPQPLEDPQPRVPIPNQQHLIQESSHRPTSGRQPNQVFHSPEEVNIPLQHRRPQTVRTFARPTNEHLEY